MPTIEIHPSAFHEIKGAKLWYDEKSEGLGSRFIMDLDRGMECIQANPDSWPLYVSGTRRFLLHQFPFAIVYQFDGKILKVYAVMHLRRKPGYWIERFQ